MGKSIWLEDVEIEKLAPLTDEMVKIAEKQLKVKLPQAYITLLKEQNGGYIECNAYPTDVPTSWADDHVNVDYINGIAEEDGILDSEYLIEEWDLPKNLVLISGDGHTWTALDYRKTKENPPVIFVDVEDEKIIKLAPDFETFLSGLTVWEDEDDEDE
ncbi:SMI1/KNR4 family protein [Peribacillus sp. NPDC097264]|uniref:SMI1/KNR4 family protein n=1 Tax=Peribacillus sp. NPDC097264 TaxID=3390616 RepID=UPI003D00CB8C